MKKFLSILLRIILTVVILVVGFLLIVFLAGFFTGLLSNDTQDIQSTDDYQQFEIIADSDETLSDFTNAKIGIMTGSSHDGTAKEVFPETERVYFNTVADMVLAVEQGKIDGYIEDAPFLSAVLWEGADVKRLDESIKQVNNGFAFPQSESSRELREQVNAFIAASKADGTIDALMEKWFSDVEPTDHPDYSSLSGENGTIRLAVVVENKPAVYLKDNVCTGFEMELLTCFARQYGYNFKIETVPFGSVIAGIAAGKYDMAAASLNITPERE